MRSDDGEINTQKTHNLTVNRFLMCCCYSDFISFFVHFISFHWDGHGGRTSLIKYAAFSSNEVELTRNPFAKIHPSNWIVQYRWTNKNWSKNSFLSEQPESIIFQEKQNPSNESHHKGGKHTNRHICSFKIYMCGITMAVLLLLQHRWPLLLFLTNPICRMGMVTHDK